MLLHGSCYIVAGIWAGPSIENLFKWPSCCITLRKRIIYNCSRIPLSLCLFALNTSVSQFKKKKKNRAFPSGSGNLAEGPNIGHEHANLISITECFHGHRNHTSQCLQKFKPKISKLTKIPVICPVLEMRNKIVQQLQ